MSRLYSGLPRRRHFWSAALLAAAFASAGAVGATQPSSFEDSVKLQAITPFIALSNARLEGVSDGIGPVSSDLKTRLETFSAAADTALRAPGAERLVTVVQLERAYLSGMEDATRYSYGEEDLARMLSGIENTAIALKIEAGEIRGNLSKAGVDAEHADQLALLSVSAGARSAFEDKTLWMNAIVNMAGSSLPDPVVAGLEETNAALVEGLSLSGMMRVANLAGVALLQDQNARIDSEWTMIQAEVFEANQEADHAP